MEQNKINLHENQKDKTLLELEEIKKLFNQSLFRYGIKMKKEETHIFNKNFKE